MKRSITQLVRPFLGPLILLFAMCFSSVAMAAVPDNVVERKSADGALRWHYPSRFAPSMPKLEATGKKSVQRLKTTLGWQANQTVDVWVLSDLNDYFRWHDMPTKAPEWAVGLSLVGRRTVLLLNNTGKDGKLVNVPQTFEHELAHVAIDMARGKYRVPLWFNEGFAQYHANEWTLENSELVARSAASGVLIPFENIDKSFPPHHNTTSLAYAQSHHFIRDLVNRYGQDVFARILTLIRTGETFSVAFSMVTGDDFEKRELQWRQHLSKNSSALSVFADGNLLFFGASLLFIVAWGVRRRRSKLKFDHLDDDLDAMQYDTSRYPLPGYTSSTTPGRPSSRIV